MARYITAWCAKCRQEKEMVEPAFGSMRVCGDCSQEEAAATKKAHLEKLDALPLEERIRRLEERFYDQDLNPPWRVPMY